MYCFPFNDQAHLLYLPFFHKGKIDPHGRPTVIAGSDHYFHTCQPVRITFDNFENQNKFQAKLVIATGESESGRVDH